MALSRILHVLSLHPKSQKTLRLELMEARVERRDISYDTLMELPYLDAVCKETLRLYVHHLQFMIHPSHPYYRPGMRQSLSCIEC